MSSQTGIDLEAAAQLFSGALKHPEPSKAAAYAYMAATIYEAANPDAPLPMLHAFAEAAYNLAKLHARKLPREQPTNVTVDIALGLAAAHRKHLKIQVNNLYAEIIREETVLEREIAAHGPNVNVRFSYPPSRKIIELPRDLIQNVDHAIGIHFELVHILSEEEGRSTAENNLSRLLDLRAKYT